MKKFIRKSQGSQKIPGVPPEFDFLRKSQGIPNSGGTPGTADSLSMIRLYIIATYVFKCFIEMSNSK